MLARLLQSVADRIGDLWDPSLHTEGPHPWDGASIAYNMDVEDSARA